MSSPLRYPGGKRKLVPRLSELLAGSAGAFVECCVGGGALFWDLVPGFPTRAQVVLADASPAVRALYRRGVDVDLARELFADSEREGGYEALRDLLNADLQDQRCGLPANERRIAAAFWLLNRMCCNGVVRFNKRGEFNVPRGKRQSGAYLRPSEAQFCEAARATDLLRGLHPTVLADCALAVDLALRGAFVYADPPYSGGFVAYTREGWSTDDDIRLYEALGRAARDKACRVALSQPDTAWARELARDLLPGFAVEALKLPRPANVDGRGRGPVGELLIHNCGEP